MKIISELTTEELHERILHATTELIEREVAKKFEADMDAVARVTASVDEPAPLTPNQQRRETIQRARGVVDTQKNEKGYYALRIRHNTIYPCFAEFKVNAEEGMVTCILRGENNGHVSKRTQALFHPNEVFNADIGKAIALARALGIDIPQEFTDAVQPDEVVVGMVIKYGQGEPLKVLEGLEIEHSPSEYTHRTTARDSPRTQIIDDTNAEYEEV